MGLLRRPPNPTSNTSGHEQVSNGQNETPFGPLRTRGTMRPDGALNGNSGQGKAGSRVKPGRNNAQQGRGASGKEQGETGQAKALSPAWDVVLKNETRLKSSDWIGLLVDRAKELSKAMAADQTETTWKDQYNKSATKGDSKLGDLIDAQLNEYDYHQSVPTLLHALVLELRDRILESRGRGSNSRVEKKLELSSGERQAARKYIKNREHLLRYILRNLAATHYIQPKETLDASNASARAKAGAGTQERADSDNDSLEEFAKLCGSKGTNKNAGWDRPSKQTSQKPFAGKRADTPLELALAQVALGPLLHLFVAEAADKTVSQIVEWTTKDGGYTGPADKDWLHTLVASICDAMFSQDRDIDIRDREKLANAGLGTLEKLLLHEELNLKNKAIFENKDERDGNTLLHIIGRINLTQEYYKSVVSRHATLIESLVDRCPIALEMTNRQKESPYLHRVQLEPLASSSRADEVTLYLKRLTVSCDSHSRAQYLLFGNEPYMKKRPHIRLDLAFLRDRKEPIKKSVLKHYMTRLNLADTLKYVRIPHFQVEDDLKGPEDANASEEEASGGPTSNCEIIFRLLEEGNGKKDSKGRVPGQVHTILHVVVDDTCESLSNHHDPHSSRSIRACLTPFATYIEVWDWKKLDICLDTVFAVAPNLRVLHLYSSGNNSVLKGWASPVDGIARFKKLTHVRLDVMISHSVEAPSDIWVNVRGEFHQLVQKSWAVNGTGRELIIEDNLVQSWESIHSPFTTRNGNLTKGTALQDLATIENGEADSASDKLETNTWLKQMQEFAIFVDNYREGTAKPTGRSKSKQKPTKIPRIKVAVLDDGFTLIDNLEEFKSNDVYGAIFDGENDENARSMVSIQQGVEEGKAGSSFRFPQTEFYSRRGHGTLMAQLIRQSCPKAEFYIAKLEDQGKGPKTRAAIQALQWAMDNRVDVVCMSWVIMQPHADATSRPDTSELIKILQECSKKMLLFGAACDQGNNLSENTLVLPGALPGGGVFYIGAADPSGNLDPHVESDAQFAFPGGDRECAYRGSSYANALAAGHAAVLLHCAEVSGFCEENPGAREWLRRYEGMYKVFRSLCGENERNKKYLKVWDRLKVDQLRRDGGGGKEKQMFKKEITEILGPVMKLLKTTEGEGADEEDETEEEEEGDKAEE